MWTIPIVIDRSGASNLTIDDDNAICVVKVSHVTMTVSNGANGTLMFASLTINATLGGTNPIVISATQQKMYMPLVGR